MKNKAKYIIEKSINKKHTITIDCNQISGFDLTNEHKKTIKGVTVNKLIIVNKKFIEAVVDKKVSKKLKQLLELLATICESDDETGNSMNLALTEVERFKRIVHTEYSRYIQKKQLEILTKKVKLIEDELKMKLYQYNSRKNIYMKSIVEPQEEMDKSSRRRR